MPNLAYLLRSVAVVVFGVLGVGCTHTGKEKYLELAQPGEASSSRATDPTRAIVYFMRARTWDHDINPLLALNPPQYFAIDGKMLSIMPLGTHVTLSLEPGYHRFVVYGAIREVGGDLPKLTLAITVEAGKSYFIASKIGFPRHTLSELPESEGPPAFARSVQAKLIHAPAATVAFEAATSATKLTSTSTSKASLQSRIADSLPSQQTINDVLGGIAFVAVLALILVGGAATIASAQSLSVAPPIPPSPPMMAQAAARPVLTRASLSGGGSVGIVGSGNETTIVNYATGTKYRIEGDRIIGSDGSRYRRGLGQITSDSGATYTVVGNSMKASDGSSCDLIGDKLYCQPRR